MKKKKKYIETVYIVDTNVLHLWLSYQPNAEPPSWAKDNPTAWEGVCRRQKLAYQFCTDTRNKIIVPALIWVELHGVFLQKDIDLDDYKLWRRQRKSALQQLDHLLYASGSHFFLGEYGFDPELAVDLCRHPASPALRQSWQEGQMRRQRGEDGRVPPVKGLDGVDSALLAYAWKYAMLHPYQYVRVLSDDRGLSQMIEELHREGRVFSHETPKNLGYINVYGRKVPQRLSASCDFHPDEQLARRLFYAGDYEGAAVQWEQLTKAHVDPRPRQISASLARAYAAWSELDYPQAHKEISRVNQMLEQYRAAPEAWPTGVDEAIACQLQAQEELLLLLAKHTPTESSGLSLTLLQEREWVHALIRDLYAHARRHMQYKRYSNAALLWYRIAELLSQRRLAIRGVDPSAPRYDLLSDAPEELLKALNACGEELQLPVREQLPEKIGLIHAYMLLHALEDPYVTGMNLRKFNGIMKARNSTIFAHGFKVTTEKHIQKMLREIEGCLERFWEAESVPLSEALSMLEKHRYVQLPM